MAKKKNLEWRNCSKAATLEWRDVTEAELRSLVADWARTAELLGASAGTGGSIVFLNGEMGAGKSTFARALLETLAPGQLSKGSPTFPLVQEYRHLNGKPIYHIDLYRLKHEGELEDAGLLAQIEEPGALVLVEWASMFPDTFAYWTGPVPKGRARAKNIWVIDIEVSASGDSTRRDLTLSGPQ
jgi:tRNA threonylcarbamoyl adenosine modification protein YjeE